MIKGRSKVFAPKKIIRNSQSSQPISGRGTEVLVKTHTPVLEDKRCTTDPQDKNLNSIPDESELPIDKPIQVSGYEATESRDNLEGQVSNLSSQSDSNRRHQNDRTQIESTENIAPHSRCLQTISVSGSTASDNLSPIRNRAVNKSQIITSHPSPSTSQVDLNTVGAIENNTTSVETLKEISNAVKAPAVAKAKRKYTRKPRVLEGEALIEDTQNNLKKSNEKKKTRVKRKRRENTPEGAESKKIDPSVITMQDLCHDLRIGKKSRNHDEIMGRLARMKQNAIKARMKRDNPELEDYIDGKSGDNYTLNESRKTEPSLNSQIAPPSAPPVGPKIRIVDGQIVFDEQSLQIDRHKSARENFFAAEDVVEENDFTRVVSCGDYLKRERSQHWDIPSNELFWKGLRMFGTDFEMIAKMFPHRSRRQIKLKFNAEERSNPQKVNRVLMGIKTEEIDLDEFQRLGNLELEDLADIKAEQAQVEKEQSERLKAALENT
ncbi:putative transcription factor tfiiib [Erysiphe necator]|uniref:Putative transcription factor tfiiib n=1 Tax=Uncinula necator TaxID=52586 RepID=A0A0B1P0D9_UNCNE|nr:putative transcription factor tfiiib [Erysiphe necator]